METDATFAVSLQKLLEIITVLLRTTKNHPVVHFVLMDGVQAVLRFQKFDCLRKRFWEEKKLTIRFLKFKIRFFLFTR